MGTCEAVQTAISPAPWRAGITDLAICGEALEQAWPQKGLFPPRPHPPQVIQQALHRQPSTAAQYLQQMYAAQQQHLMLQTAALQQQHLSSAQLQSLAAVQQVRPRMPPKEAGEETGAPPSHTFSDCLLMAPLWSRHHCHPHPSADEERGSGRLRPPPGSTELSSRAGLAQGGTACLTTAPHRREGTEGARRRPQKAVTHAAHPSALSG